MRQSSNARFREKLGRRNPTTECVLWAASTGAAGSGRFNIKVAGGGRKAAYAARCAWALEHLGSVDREPEVKGVVVQTCGNPLCCAPGHLEIRPNTRGIKKRRVRGPLTSWEQDMIRGLRTIGHSQQHVAEFLGIAQTTVSRFERAEKEKTSCSA